MAKKIVNVPDPQSRPYDKDRLLTKEGLDLVKKWNEMEKKLPSDHQSGIDITSIRTQGQKNVYTEALLSRMLAKTTVLPQRLSLMQMAVVALATLVLLGLLMLVLVFVTKQISSLVLVILVISAGLFLFLILVAVVLLISGHLSENIAERLISRVLGKIPALGKLLPKTSPRDSPEE